MTTIFIGDLLFPFGKALPQNLKLFIRFKWVSVLYNLSLVFEMAAVKDSGCLSPVYSV